MLDTILNVSNDSRIRALNQFITRYNQLLSKPKPYSLQKIQKMMRLLDVIHYAGEHLKKRKTEADGDFNLPNIRDSEMVYIRLWEGISKEVAEIQKPLSSSLALENQLLSFSTSTFDLSDSKKWFPKKSFGKISSEQKKVIEQLEALLKIKSITDPSSTGLISYFYKLKQFKASLLEKIAFHSLNKKDMEKMMRLLGPLNHEILNVIQLTPSLKNRYGAHMLYASTRLSAELLALDRLILDHLKEALMQKTILDSGKDLVSIVPAFEDYDIKKLSSGNNQIFKLKHKNTKEKLMMCIEEPEKHPTFLAKLENTLVNENFTHHYARFYPTTFANETTLTITEYAAGKDLDYERKKKLKDATNYTITLYACLRIIEIIRICKLLAKENGSHIDIKLTNFLVDEKGNLVIGDRKGILPLLENGTVNRKRYTMWTSEIYAPPEFSEGKDMEPHPFNIYQLGLALYDYLIAPPIDKKALQKTGDKSLIWSMKNSLDFDKPYFQSKTGKSMQELIGKMINLNPSKRPTFDDVCRELNSIRHLTEKRNQRSIEDDEVKWLTSCSDGNEIVIKEIVI